MLEHPAFRPKVCTILFVAVVCTNVYQLFFARGHPNAGQEEKFPDPDNPSKMRRSVENAEHIGLYPSRLIQGSLEPPVAAPSAKCSKCLVVEKRGRFLPPARAIMAKPKSTVYVDTNCPTDPFSGIITRPLP